MLLVIQNQSSLRKVPKPTPGPNFFNLSHVTVPLTMQLLFRGILYASLLRTILLNTYTVNKFVQGVDDKLGQFLDQDI
jgi:hypothetical protein